MGQSRDIEIKTNIAVRELSKAPYKLSKKDLYAMSFEELECLYIQTFDTPLVRKSRKLRAELKNGYIYIIGSLADGVCKIGFSRNPKNRLKELQTGCPYKLTIFFMVEGNIPTEKKLHKKYSEYSTHGEWFRIEGDLKNIIENRLKNFEL